MSIFLWLLSGVSLFELSVPFDDPCGSSSGSSNSVNDPFKEPVSDSTTGSVTSMMACCELLLMLQSIISARVGEVLVAVFIMVPELVTLVVMVSNTVASLFSVPMVQFPVVGSYEASLSIQVSPPSHDTLWLMYSNPVGNLSVTIRFWQVSGPS